MNLCIEYIVRTGGVKNFFNAPCCLFLENTKDKKRIVINLYKDKNKPDIIFIKQWHVLEKNKKNNVKKQIFYCHKSQVFENSKIIIPNFLPIKYLEKNIPVDKNYYNRPIDIDDLDILQNNFLNSEHHKSYKRDWLWDSFAKVYFKGLIVCDKMSLPILERRYIIEQEKKYIKLKYEIYWKKWNNWIRKLIQEEEKIATELIFLPCFLKTTNF